MTHITQQMQHCIDECNKCRDLCLETLAYSLHQGGKHTKARHLTTLQDCAAVCDLAAGFMLRDSSLHGETCRACALICEMCYRSCKDMLAGESDSQVEACANQCSSCAGSCDFMARNSPKLAA